MQQMETADYVNERPRCGQKCSGDTHQTDFTERKLSQLLFLSFGLLCIIQATLNVALRLTLYSSNESTPLGCNATHFSDRNKLKEVQDCEQRRNDQYNRLQEKIIALTKDIKECENRNTVLNNRIKKVQEDMDRLKGLDGSLSSQWCLPDWRLINSRCYFISNESKTWSESRKYCQTKGADLVVINSEEEQKALYRLDGDVYLLFWIGLYDMAGTFKWVDRSALTKQFWQSGQPDHGDVNNREDCVEMYHFNPELANWNDAPCESKRRWLCEGSVYTITP